jgi:hypothetical protein
MKKITISLIIVLVLTVGYILIFGLKPDKQTPNNQTAVLSPSLLPTGTQPVETTSYKADFEIYTNGIRRIFTDSKYHNLSKDLYITADKPDTIIINKKGLTWSDFFETLPMQLTPDCLTTGTGQTFCSNENHKLKFFLNDKETPDALSLLIEKDSALVVKYE